MWSIPTGFYFLVSFKKIYVQSYAPSSSSGESDKPQWIGHIRWFIFLGICDFLYCCAPYLFSLILPVRFKPKLYIYMYPQPWKHFSITCFPYEILINSLDLLLNQWFITQFWFWLITDYTTEFPAAGKILVLSHVQDSLCNIYLPRYKNHLWKLLYLGHTLFIFMSYFPNNVLCCQVLHSLFYILIEKSKK